MLRPIQSRDQPLPPLNDRPPPIPASPPCTTPPVARSIRGPGAIRHSHLVISRRRLRRRTARRFRRAAGQKLVIRRLSQVDCRFPKPMLERGL